MMFSGSIGRELLRQSIFVTFMISCDNAHMTKISVAWIEWEIQVMRARVGGEFPLQIRREVWTWWI